MRKSLATGAAAMLAVIASSAAFAAPASIVTASALGDAALSKSALKQNVQYCGCPRQRAAYAPYWAGPTSSYYYGAYPAPAPVYYMAPAPIVAAPAVPAVPVYAPPPVAQPYAPAPVVAPMAPFPTTPVVTTAPAFPFSLF